MDFDLIDVKNLVDTFDPEQPTGDAYLDARYDAHVAEYGHGKPYWRMFYRLCARFRPGLAVELGAWQGTCAAHMAGGGAWTVATIDHHNDRRGETHPPGDDVNEALCRDAMQRYANLFYFRGWTTDERVIADVRDLGKPIDVLFIDGWHHYDKAMADWDAYRPMLAVPSLVVCDDLENVEPTLHKMVEFWDDVSWNRERFTVKGISTYPVGFFKYEG